MAHHSPESARLGDSTWRDIDAPLLAVPLGSCEQHGPHLPLDTDTRIACALAERLAAADEMTNVLVTPPLAITASGEHDGFPGTLSIGNTALELVLIELVRSADWSRGVVFVNGHGGNVAAVTEAAATLTNEGRRVLSWWPRVDGGDAHAGRVETSLLLALAPETVRLDVASAGNTEPIAKLSARLRTEGVASVSPNGVLGDPAGASADEGHDLLAALVADLVERVTAWAT